MNALVHIQNVLVIFFEITFGAIGNLLGIVETVECVVSRAKVDACSLEKALIKIVC